ncbi:type II toxin-antitoxin system VapC family toxin [Sphingomonas sp. KR3-1]|uniref:type II toxin-antitoxin system VapC family toxin n=1 Tax=Sphingomonas sp. KR3-1 TaxID=3156611 RepID=UPI0032B45554
MTEPAFLLDANICIYVLADSQGAASRAVQTQNEGTVVTSSIVFGEVMRGIPPEETEAIRQAMAFFELVTPLPFDRVAAERYARLPFRRASFDPLIAAHALALGLTLVTNNERDFADIPGLRIENWTL